MKYLFAFLGMLMMNISFSSPITANNDPYVELGKVDWIRDLDQGIAQSKQKNKPIFLLFQEVPGCSTCQHYGKKVLSHPLIVEAIENLFIPVAIFNNRGGKDAEVLKAFDEPSWNNPVVRIITHRKDNIVPRIHRDYSRLGIVQSMIIALKSQLMAVPPYLRILEEELLAERRGTETAVVSMYCFWSGEQKLGQINGVVATDAGFMGGREVVKVEYDPTELSYEELIKTAKSNSCASHVYSVNENQKRIATKIVGSNSVSEVNTFRMDKEPKYYLTNSHYRFVPMTALQASRVNSALAARKSPDALLSPRQQWLANHFKNNKGRNAVNVELTKAWKSVEHLKVMP